MVRSEGDMRRAIQMLQSVHRLYGEHMPHPHPHPHPQPQPQP